MGAYSRDKNTCVGTLAENGRGAYAREWAYSWDTTVISTFNALKSVKASCLKATSPGFHPGFLSRGGKCGE